MDIARACSTKPKCLIQAGLQLAKWLKQIDVIPANKHHTKHLGRWSPTLGLQMSLDFNSQKSWPADVVVKASRSCSPRTSGGPRLRTTDLGYVLLAWGYKPSSCQLDFQALSLKTAGTSIPKSLSLYGQPCDVGIGSPRHLKGQRLNTIALTH